MPMIQFKKFKYINGIYFVDIEALIKISSESEEMIYHFLKIYPSSLFCPEREECEMQSTSFLNK